MCPYGDIRGLVLGVGVPDDDVLPIDLRHQHRTNLVDGRLGGPLTVREN